MKVQLETQQGEFATELEIPPFLDGAPSVVIWGIRVFLRTNENRYQETTYWVVPSVPTSPARLSGF
jgi:hypothetical protein